MCSQQSLDFITVTANNRFSAIFTTVFLPRSTGNVPLPITSEVYRLAGLHCPRLCGSPDRHSRRGDCRPRHELSCTQRSRYAPAMRWWMPISARRRRLKWGERASNFLKAKLKETGVTYIDFAKRFNLRSTASPKRRRRLRTSQSAGFFHDVLSGVPCSDGIRRESR
jgi:hypothetical protein